MADDASVSKAAIEERLGQLRQQQAQFVANVQAMQGAIQLCEELVKLAEQSVHGNGAGPVTHEET